MTNRGTKIIFTSDFISSTEIRDFIHLTYVCMYVCVLVCVCVERERVGMVKNVAKY